MRGPRWVYKDEDGDEDGDGFDIDIDINIESIEKNSVRTTCEEKYLHTLSCLTLLLIIITFLALKPTRSEKDRWKGVMTA